MTEIFTGWSRSEDAARFIEKIEAAGGTVVEAWADQDVETGVSYIEVSYDMPEADEEEKMSETTMSTGATESMKREIDWFCDVHGVTDETMIADIGAMFRSAYEWGRIAAQGEQFTEHDASKLLPPVGVPVLVLCQYGWQVGKLDGAGAFVLALAVRP